MSCTKFSIATCATRPWAGGCAATQDPRKIRARHVTWACGWRSPYCAFANKWRVILKSISNPPFSRRWEHFQKSASVVALLPQFLVQPRRPIFEKCSHLRKKGGVLMLFKMTLHLWTKAQYPQRYKYIGTKFSTSEVEWSCWCCWVHDEIYSHIYSECIQNQKIFRWSRLLFLTLVLNLVGHYISDES